MNVELTEPQKKWIAALRSGEFRQGRHSLATCDGFFCCLGVACEVAKDDLALVTSVYAGSRRTYDEFDTLPPAKVAEHFGLYDREGSSPDPEVRRLWELNDCLALPFNEIADLLETGAYFKPQEVPA